MIEAMLAFLFGLLIGSFLNVCIYRLPRDLSVVRPRSFCPACGRQIAWYDNIPLVSFIVLRARCRFCGAAISWRYPAVELLTGALFASCVFTFGPTPLALKYCVFAAILITLIVSDIEALILPDEFTLGGIVAGLVLAWIVPLDAVLARVIAPEVQNPRVLSLIEAALGALIAAGSIWLVAAVYQRIRRREGMGLGDVKMIAMIGVFLGLQGSLLTLVLGSLLGSIVGFAYIRLTGKDASTYQLPFGAFLGSAALTVAIFGEPLLHWYRALGA